MKAVAFEKDLTIICEDDEVGRYNCGENLEVYGIDNLNREEMAALYASLPVTVSPEEFLAGAGNWGLTQAEHDVAMTLAQAMTIKNEVG